MLVLSFQAAASPCFTCLGMELLGSFCRASCGVSKCHPTVVIPGQCVASVYAWAFLRDLDGAAATFGVLWPQQPPQEVALICSKKTFSVWWVRPAKQGGRLPGGIWVSTSLGGGIKDRLNRSSVPWDGVCGEACVHTCMGGMHVHVCAHVRVYVRAHVHICAH